jgi:hypothetical protein
MEKRSQTSFWCIVMSYELYRVKKEVFFSVHFYYFKVEPRYANLAKESLIMTNKKTERKRFKYRYNKETPIRHLRNAST